ncbi:MAG: hypothetical protein KY475_08610 [Planctomycetes bacterium]|nr:hypothetical protein [Planctomycetota bacterium]
MGDNPVNPYVSPSTASDEARRRRPIGTVVLAIVFLILGVWLGGGGALRFIQNWSQMGPPSSLRAYAPFVHFGIIASVFVVASPGLLFLRRWGWWATILLCYLVLATFILVPVVRFERGDPVLRRIVIGTVLLLCWLYLHQRHVRASLGEPAAGCWRTHAGLLALSIITVFGFVFL